MRSNVAGRDEISLWRAKGLKIGYRFPYLLCKEGDRMSEHRRKEELEHRLEQSRRLLRNVSDDATCQRIGRLIGDLTRTATFNGEVGPPQWATSRYFL
jgi:hypothetical protein